jgi:hypothetical protein
VDDDIEDLLDLGLEFVAFRCLCAHCIVCRLVSEMTILSGYGASDPNEARQRRAV